MTTPTQGGDGRVGEGSGEPIEPPRSMPEASARVRSRVIPRPGDKKRGDPLRDLLRAGIMLGEWKPHHRHYLKVCVSADTLAKEMGTHAQTARNRLDEAERRGLIRVIDRGGGRARAKVWAIDWDALDRLPPIGKPRATGDSFGRKSTAPDATDSPKKPPLLSQENRNGNTRADPHKHSRRDPETPAPQTRAPYLHKYTTTRGAAGGGKGAANDRSVGGGGGGDFIPEGWTEADHADAMNLARKIGHRDPSGFVNRAGKLDRVAWLEEETRSATNPAAAAEIRLRKNEAPPPEWSESRRRQREGKRRAKAKKAEAEQRDQAKRLETLRDLSAAHLAAFVKRRALEILHLDGPNRPARAANLRRVHEAGRLFEPSPDAEKALAELVCVGGTIGAFHTEIRKSRPKGEARPFSASAGAGSHDAA